MSDDFEGIKITGLRHDEIAATKAALLAKIAGREYRIEGLRWETTPSKTVKRSVPVDMQETEIRGEKYYALHADSRNLTAGQYDEFGWKATVESAIKAAKDNRGEDLDLIAGTCIVAKYIPGEEIDGTGRFLVVFTGGSADAFNPGYCGSE